MISETEVSGRKVFKTISGIGAASVNLSLFVVPSPTAKYRLTGASWRHGTAGGSGAKAQLEVAGAAIAVASGVNQLDTAFDLTATANTSQFQKVSSPTIFDYNSVVNLILSGTLTALANGVLTMEFEKVN